MPRGAWLCCGGGQRPAPALLSPPPPAQAYVEKYKFTSVVAQDLLDSFLSFFPELREQSVDCRAGEARGRPCIQGQLPLAPPRALA